MIKHTTLSHLSLPALDENAPSRLARGSRGRVSLGKHQTRQKLRAPLISHPRSEKIDQSANLRRTLDLYSSKLSARTLALKY